MSPLNIIHAQVLGLSKNTRAYNQSITTSFNPDKIKIDRIY